MKREDVEALLAHMKRYGSPPDWASDIIPELCRRWIVVEDAPEAWVSVTGMAEGSDLLGLEPRDRQDREAIRRMHGIVRIVPASQGRRSTGG